MGRFHHHANATLNVEPLTSESAAAVAASTRKDANNRAEGRFESLPPHGVEAISCSPAFGSVPFFV